MMDTIAKLREKHDLHMTVERYTAETPETEKSIHQKVDIKQINRNLV